MTDKKYTDEEIVMALECCAGILECKNCPLIAEDNCTYRNINYVRSLVNRQKAEIERLTEENRRMKKYYYTHDYHECHNEAINEFSEMLKEYLDDFYSTDEDALFDTVSAIDEIAKELTEGNHEQGKED